MESDEWYEPITIGKYSWVSNCRVSDSSLTQTKTSVAWDRFLRNYQCDESWFAWCEVCYSYFMQLVSQRRCKTSCMENVNVEQALNKLLAWTSVVYIIVYVEIMLLTLESRIVHDFLSNTRWWTLGIRFRIADYHTQFKICHASDAWSPVPIGGLMLKNVVSRIPDRRC